MIRFVVALTLTFPVIRAFAAEPAKTSKTEVTVNETIVHKHSLAEHMGWDNQDAVFNAPRNFRSQQLNEMRLDINDDVEPIKN